MTEIPSICSNVSAFTIKFILAKTRTSMCEKNPSWRIQDGNWEVLKFLHWNDIVSRAVASVIFPILLFYLKI